jgi:hypothetical protein
MTTRAVWVGLANGGAGDGGAGDEVEVVKKRQRNRLGASASQTILWPVVSIAEAPPDLTEAQFAALETAGRISLTLETRRALNNVAESWVSHDQMLRSPRPANFRSRLQSIRTSLEKAHARADLNRMGATPFERHLYHWLLGLPGGIDGLSQLAALNGIIEFLHRAERFLPLDSGSARPRNDYRFIQYLADQFEACGGKARAYVSSHSDEGYAKTPFRQFVHRFYEFVSLNSRHTGRGLDEAIRQALMDRRRRSSV